MNTGSKQDSSSSLSPSRYRPASVLDMDDGDSHAHSAAATAPEPLTFFIVKATIIASLGGILFGYDLGVVSGALPQLTAAFGLTESQQETVVSFLYLGAAVGAAAGGHVCDKFGRRFAILMTDVIFLMGATLLSMSNSYSTLLLGRFVMGVGVSLSGCADVAYLTEISPPYWRGSIVSCNEACISLGFLLAYSSGYFIDTFDGTNGWRLMFGLSSIYAVIQGIGMLPMPESPIWLRGQGRIREAKAAFGQIHSLSNEAEEERFYKNMFWEKEQEEAAADPLVVKVHSPMMQAKELYRQCIVAAFLSILQQLCGHTNILNFADRKSVV